MHPSPVDCSGWLLGRKDDVPNYSASRTDFLLIDCSNDTAANAGGTASGIDTDADASYAVDTSNGDFALIAEVDSETGLPPGLSCSP